MKHTITNSSVSLSAWCSGKNKRYLLELELFNEIDPDASVFSTASVGRATFKLRKKVNNTNWSRLLKSKANAPRNMHVWWSLSEKYKDEMKAIQTEKKNETANQNPEKEKEKASEEGKNEEADTVDERTPEQIAIDAEKEKAKKAYRKRVRLVKKREKKHLKKIKRDQKEEQKDTESKHKEELDNIKKKYEQKIASAKESATKERDALDEALKQEIARIEAGEFAGSDDGSSYFGSIFDNVLKSFFPDSKQPDATSADSAIHSSEL